MKILRPLRWSEGLFLRPHHFQHLDLYLESREINRLLAFESCGWGLERLGLDENALANFSFKIDTLRAVLPEGTLIDVPENARVDGRSFEALMTEVGKPMDVWLGVRARDERGPHTLQSGGGAAADARFLPAEEEIYDVDVGRNPVPAERLHYNLRVFFGDEPTEGYEAMPLARLVRTGDTGRPVRADNAFAPPCMAVAASPVLHDAARSVVERLSVVLRDLGQARGGNDPDPLILYYGLSGSLPVLKEMVQEGAVHPRRLYHELARLAGALFYRDKEGRSAEEIPAYSHREPAPVFLRLQQLITELTELVIQRAYRRCPMEREEDLYRVALPAEAKQPGTRFFLEVEADDSLQRVPMLIMAAKASNPGRIETLRSHALPGVPTEPQSGPPQQLPPGQSGTYFRLKHEQTEWTTHVTPAGELAVFILNAPEDLRMNLIVVLSGA